MQTERTIEQRLKHSAILKNYETQAFQLANSRLADIYSNMNVQSPMQVMEAVNKMWPEYNEQLTALFAERDKVIAEFNGECDRENLANAAAEHRKAGAVSIVDCRDAMRKLSEAMKSMCGQLSRADDDQPPLPEEPAGRIDIKEAVEAMYYHTKKANLVWWALIGLLTLLFIAGHATTAAMTWAVASLLLGLMQNVWQGTALERFVRRLDGEGITRFDGYPDHISNGGWAFYALKMIAVLIGLAVMIIGWV